MNYELPQVGLKVNDWTLTRFLGNGFFGDVFLAEQEGHLAAVKFMKTDAFGQQGTTELDAAIKNFLDEADRSMNFGDFPYVLNAIDVGEKPWPWILFPYLNNGTVMDLAIKSQGLSESVWWNLAHDVLSGLDAIHSEGLVHKDIKWDNVMAVDDRFVIVDLGIAEVSGFEEFSGARFNLELTPPEVLSSVRNWSEVDPAQFEPSADVFAAGMMLYQCLFGRPVWPMEKLTSSAERNARLTREKPDLSQLPTAMSSLLGKMLEIEKRKRPSARTLLFDVVPHIDIAAKVQQIDDAYHESLEQALVHDENREPVSHETREYDLSAPFNGWNTLADELERIIEDIRPSFFVVDVNLLGSNKTLYFQAMSHNPGWTLELVSQKFQDEADGRDLRVKLKQLGWNPPTSSSPNYERDEADPSTRDLIMAFVGALEIAYKVKPDGIRSFHIRTQDIGAY